MLTCELLDLKDGETTRQREIHQIPLLQFSNVLTYTVIFQKMELICEYVPKIWHWYNFQRSSHSASVSRKIFFEKIWFMFKKCIHFCLISCVIPMAPTSLFGPHRYSRGAHVEHTCHLSTCTPHVHRNVIALQLCSLIQLCTMWKRLISPCLNSHHMVSYLYHV